MFYTSGRASLEAAYMYACLRALYGTNNLPDSSNMCHESTSVALPESIGVPVGTVTLDDFQQDRMHLLLRPERRHVELPRMLHDLQMRASAAYRSSPSIHCANAARALHQSADRRSRC